MGSADDSPDQFYFFPVWGITQRNIDPVRLIHEGPFIRIGFNAVFSMVPSHSAVTDPSKRQIRIDEMHHGFIDGPGT